MSERQLLKYKLLEEVGHGGMAVVYRGLDTTLNREVAIKILHHHLAEEQESRRRFQREAQAVAKLRHDNIIEIYDYSGLESPESFIVTEFIHGQTLKDYLARNPISHPEIAAMIIVEVCTALEHAHSLGVIHRDIKPENIMIRDDGRVKLTDFGIAQVVDVQRLTITGQLLGSPAYMAPELVEGKPVDFRADVYSVGTLLYQLATSELPFKGKNPHEVLKRIADGRYIDPEVANPIVGAKLARIINKALAHDPEARYHNVIKLKEELLGYLADVGISDPRLELSRYFAGPTGYSRELQKRVVEALTQAGKEALDSRRTPLALECFNRVLCADPTNEEVLQILNQITRRRQWGRALGAAVLVALLGVGGFAVSSYWPMDFSSAAPPADAAGGLSLLAPSTHDGASATAPTDMRLASSPTPETGAVADASRFSQPAKGANVALRPRPAAPALERVEIIPTPKAVAIWLNGKRLGDYGPDLRAVRVPRGATSRLIFRNNACCFEREVSLGPREFPEVLRVRLPWKPARVQVTVEPKVEADVLVGTLVMRPGQAAEVPIPSYSDDGKDVVAIKVSARGYATETRQVTVRANTTVTVPVRLRSFP